MNSVTRRTALVLCLLGIFAGCWGARLIQQQQQQQPGAQDKPRKVRPLEKVKAPADLGQQAFAHVKTVVGFGAREPGTEGWARQLDYIATELKKCGLQPVRDRWTDALVKVTFENISATLPGAMPERIVIACHHDTKRTHGHADAARNFPFVGANDGGSGVGLMLALIKELQTKQHRATLQFVFFDGEESLDWDWNDDRSLFGARRFVKAHRDNLLLGKESRVLALVLLDMVGRKDLLIDEEERSTAELLEITWSAAVACGHQARFFKHRWKIKDDHVPFLDAGIPSVDLIDLKENRHWHTATDVLENMAPESLQLVGEVVLTMLPEVEREYLPAPRTGR